ncbi:kinase-like domain-containing protein [Aspergillus aurantiobrunneus]
MEAARFFESNYGIVLPHQDIEEECLPDYLASRYYPTQIGEVIKDRYQVVGKLGHGVTSTPPADNEIEIYKRINRHSKHPGRRAIRSLVDSFSINGPEDTHQCLVHPPLFESMWDFLHRNPVKRLPTVIVALTIRQLFLALVYLHTECQIIHTDLKPDNMMFQVVDDSIFTAFEEEELQSPSPRKEIDGRSIYLSRELKISARKLGAPVLYDFGSAVLGDREHTEDVQPDIYRSPEVTLGVPWWYSIDIWNVGCMIWNLFQGGRLFTGHDPEFQKYRSRAHLAEMINLLGPPPRSLLAKGNQSQRFFLESGEFREKHLLRDPTPLEQRETTLEGEDRACFLRFMRKMLQWEPEKRSSAKELAEDEWIRKHTT